MNVTPKFRQSSGRNRSEGRLPESPPLAAESVAWPAIESYLATDDRVILPIGSQEQHGRHLPLAVDWMIPHALGQLVSARSGVFCASPICYGMSSLHSAFPGTLCLKPETLIAVYRDVVEELYAQGFRRVLIINGHGGNINALNASLSSVVRRFADIRAVVHNWWTIPPVVEICLHSFGDVDSHAGPAETSTMLHLFPNAVEMSAACDQESDLLPFFPSPAEIRKLYPDGVMQNRATKADAGVGAEIVSACVEFFCEALT